MSRSSKRFNPPKWSQWLVPTLLVVLLLGLVVAIAIVVGSVLGFFPGV